MGDSGLVKKMDTQKDTADSILNPSYPSQVRSDLSNFRAISNRNFSRSLRLDFFTTFLNVLREDCHKIVASHIKKAGVFCSQN